MLKETKGQNKIAKKRAVSLMVSYVILISIVISVSIGIYAWLKTMTGPVEIVDCKEGTSIILENYECTIGNIRLNLKNNGRFNINGVIVSIGNNPLQMPVTYPIPQISGGVLEGHYQFKDPIKPGQVSKADFTNKEYLGGVENRISFQNVGVIQIQPFIIENNKRINCQNSVIKQEISNCRIGV